MECSIKKIIKCSIFIIMAFIFMCDYVYAADDDFLPAVNICYKGNLYGVSPIATDASFNEENYSKIGEIYTALLRGDISFRPNFYNNMSHVGTFTLNSVTYKYRLLGRYSNDGGPTTIPMCYVVYTNNSGTITAVSDPSASITYNYSSFEASSCNNGYDINEDLYIDDEIRLADLTSDEIKELTNAQLYSYQKVSQSTGTISFIIRPKTGTKIYNEFSRLKYSEYTYGDTSNTASKGHVEINYDEKYIKVSGVTPYNTLNDDPNSNANYTISFYLDEIKSSDFPANINNLDGVIKQCGGSNSGIYLGDFTRAIKADQDVLFTNGYLNHQKCKDVKEYAKNRSSSTQALIKSYITECYTPFIRYSEKDGILDRIETKFKTIKKIYDGIKEKQLSEIANHEEIRCDDELERLGIPIEKGSSVQFDSKVTYEKMGTYWGMVCIEDYYIDGGTPQLVAAGTGVKYENKVQINKACTIIQLATVKKRPECKITTSTPYCPHSGGSFGALTIRINGGPTKNFDECVNKCDGGLYTQNCINSCYSNSYSDERTGAFSSVSSNLLSYNTKNSSSTVEDSQFIGSCTINSYGIKDCGNGFRIEVVAGVWFTGPEYNKPGKATVYHNNDVLREFGYSQWCADRGNTCTVSFYKGPSNCSDNPERDYDAEVLASKNELNNLIALAKAKSEVEDYTITLTDTLTGIKYKVSGSSIEEKEYDSPELVFDYLEEESEKRSNENYSSVQFGELSGYEDKVTSTTVTTVYNISLPESYVKIGEPEVIAVKNSNTNRYYGYKSNVTYNDEGSFYTFTDFDTASGEAFNPSLYEGGNYYFTSFNSDKFNVDMIQGLSQSELEAKKEELKNRTYAEEVYLGTPTLFVLVRDEANIKVDISVGYNDNGFVSFDPTQIYCYYGVVPFIYNNQPDPDGSGGSGPGGSGGGTTTFKNGLMYYYREIKLDDVFPNGRNPRWNWTGTIDSTGNVSGAANNDDPSYLVDPVAVTKKIEKDGETIFDKPEEVDYEFTLTPALIRIIREYNKSKDESGNIITYLDFKLAANSTSKSNYSEKIKEWFSDSLYGQAISITECNNAKGTSCDMLDR